MWRFTAPRTAGATRWSAAEAAQPGFAAQPPRAAADNLKLSPPAHPPALLQHRAIEDDALTPRQADTDTGHLIDAGTVPIENSGLSDGINGCLLHVTSTDSIGSAAPVRRRRELTFGPCAVVAS